MTDKTSPTNFKDMNADSIIIKDNNNQPTGYQLTFNKSFAKRIISEIKDTSLTTNSLFVSFISSVDPKQDQLKIKKTSDTQFSSISTNDLISFLMKTLRLEFKRQNILTSLKCLIVHIPKEISESNTKTITTLIDSKLSTINSTLSALVLDQFVHSENKEDDKKQTSDNIPGYIIFIYNDNWNVEDIPKLCNNIASVFVEKVINRNVKITPQTSEDPKPTTEENTFFSTLITESCQQIFNQRKYF